MPSSGASPQRQTLRTEQKSSDGKRKSDDEERRTAQVSDDGSENA